MIFEFLKRIFTPKKREFEAKLYPVASTNAAGVGEIELKIRDSSKVELELSLKRANLLLGTKLDFRIAGTSIATLEVQANQVQSGYIKEYRFISTNELKQPVDEGVTAEIWVDNQVRYQGVFRLD